MRHLGRALARHRAPILVALVLCTVTWPFGSSIAFAAPASLTTAAGEAFAQQVLDHAFLPAGAHPTTKDSTTINHFFPLDIGLPVGTPASASALFATSLSPAAAAAAIELHYPHRALVTTNGPPPPGITAIALLPSVSGPNQEGAEVIYSIAADGTGSELRIKATVIWAPDRPRTESVSSTGPVTVTGYTSGSLDGGATDPVTVDVRGKEASQLRHAFNELYRAAAPPDCMEDISSFRIAFPSTPKSKSSVTAVTFPCGGRTLVVRTASQSLAPLRGNCTLLTEVAKVLPSGKGVLTRKSARTCRTHRVLG